LFLSLVLGHDLDQIFERGVSIPKSEHGLRRTAVHVDGAAERGTEVHAPVGRVPVDMVSRPVSAHQVKFLVSELPILLLNAPGEAHLEINGEIPNSSSSSILKKRVCKEST
jgi:hypothetical protein